MRQPADMSHSDHELDALGPAAAIGGATGTLILDLAERLAAATGAERVVMAVAESVAQAAHAGFVEVTVERRRHAAASGAPRAARPLVGVYGARPSTDEEDRRVDIRDSEGSRLGEIRVASPRAGGFSDATIQTLEETAALVATVLATAAAEPDLTEFAEGAFMALAAALDSRAAFSEGRAARVAAMCDVIGRDLELDDGRLIVLRGAAAVYDSGNLITPDEVLNKSEPLDVGEILAVQQHVQRTLEILRRIELPSELDDVRVIAAQHHERVDGSGYPLGLRGDAILIESRILIVVDVLDAMMSERPYRPALPADHVMDHIRKGSDTLFDADVVASLDRNLPSILAMWEDAN